MNHSMTKLLGMESFALFIASLKFCPSTKSMTIQKAKTLSTNLGSYSGKKECTFTMVGWLMFIMIIASLLAGSITKCYHVDNKANNNEIPYVSLGMYFSAYICPVSVS